jgi:hypothetical protein
MNRMAKLATVVQSDPRLFQGREPLPIPSSIFCGFLIGRESHHDLGNLNLGEVRSVKNAHPRIFPSETLRPVRIRNSLDVRSNPAGAFSGFLA